MFGYSKDRFLVLEQVKHFLKAIFSINYLHYFIFIYTNTLSLYLFDGPKQPAIAVDHHQDRQSQAESEEADDVGVRLDRLNRPGYRAACSCPLYAIAAPAQQRGHRPEQGVQPRAPNSQQGLTVVWPTLVVHSQSAVAVVREDHQRNQ